MTTQFGNAVMLVTDIATTAPHHCDDPKCPGNITRRKLEAFEEMRQALAALLLLDARMHYLAEFSYMPQDSVAIIDARATLQRPGEIT